jgi:hypothetical protein
VQQAMAALSWFTHGVKLPPLMMATISLCMFAQAQAQNPSGTSPGLSAVNSCPSAKLGHGARRLALLFSHVLLNEIVICHSL